MTVATQFDLVLRVLIAGACGFAIGYERNARAKTAGLRTHIIIIMGAALMMIVSKYGFIDLLGDKGIGLDPSRIAAQIVSGIGFIGAGTIIVKHDDVNGLTTATGLWTTAGIGMAIGARMFVVGVTATLLVLATQVMLNRDLSWLHLPKTSEVRLSIQPGSHNISAVQDALQKKEIDVTKLRVRKMDTEVIVKMKLQFVASLDNVALTRIFEAIPEIREIEIY
ncbi:MgtC/SapB family protein [Pediococcus siamensis]|uniref:MgtC/SapB family protein n=1 Tax=Pediococcus siamensis TaxID=381829 RepID=UPI0039A27F4D